MGGELGVEFVVVRGATEKGAEAMEESRRFMGVEPRGMEVGDGKETKEVNEQKANCESVIGDVGTRRESSE